MISEQLQKVRAFEEKYMPKISEGERPCFHITGGTGWINDPNGFSLYKGEYHLFFQYHPYSTSWGLMHWGHVKTKDFIRWERLPVALAPDTEYDVDGCFSGSAIETADGKHLLMYTGVRIGREDSGRMKETQIQCMAVGDGVNYEKYEGNPVLTGDDVPEGGSHTDFRDPKIWYDGEEKKYFAVVGNRPADGSGMIILYESEDGFHWNFRSVIDESRNEYGGMWECPDFFPLDGRQILLVSPQDMHPIGLEFHVGNGTACLIGSYDKKNASFTREHIHAIDYGIDFYAPQTLLTEDGRRVMIAWMQDPAASRSKPENCRWFGQMTLPRELSLRDGRLIQQPVRELENYRRNKVRFENILVTRDTNLPGIQGRVLDMAVTIRPVSSKGFRYFYIKLAQDGKHVTTLRYKPEFSTIRVDRSCSGVPCDIVHVREFYAKPQDGKLKLRIIMDRNTLEVFVNDGEQAASFMIYTPIIADAISFEADGSVLMDVEKYDLIFEEKKGENNG